MHKMSDVELKLKLKSMLHDFKEICNTNSIPYFLCWGTLLGAARHNGFIPWDDDMDVCIFRQDYERLRSIINSNEKYKFVDHTNNNEYYWNFARFTDVNTTYIESHNVPYVSGLGVFIDIFVIENAPPKDEREVWASTYKNLLTTIYAIVPSKTIYDPGIKNLKRHLYDIYRHQKMKGYNFNEIRNDLINWVKKYENTNGDDVMIPDVTFTLQSQIFPKELFSEVTTLEFEGELYSVPCGYDRVLQITYGDYMQLPPVDKRVSHHNFTAYQK